MFDITCNMTSRTTLNLIMIQHNISNHIHCPDLCHILTYILDNF